MIMGGLTESEILWPFFCLAACYIGLHNLELYNNNKCYVMEKRNGGRE